MENNKQFKAVSMDCNSEQFEQLRPHLEKIEGVTIIEPEWIGDNTFILVNNYCASENHITNLLFNSNSKGRTYIGAFNAKAFIEACGGEWVEETPSMKGKWVKCIKWINDSFTGGRWYQCVANDFEDFCAFIDNYSLENGNSGDNHLHFDLSNPMDFNPDTAPMAAPQPETPQPETKFKEVPFDWETYLEYKDKGAYLEFNCIKIVEAHKFNTLKSKYQIIVPCVDEIHSFTPEGRYMSGGEIALKLFIPTTTKTIRVWAILNQDGKLIGASLSNTKATNGCQVIELTKEIEIL